MSVRELTNEELVDRAAYYLRTDQADELRRRLGERDQLAEQAAGFDSCNRARSAAEAEIARLAEQVEKLTMLPPMYTAMDARKIDAYDAAHARVKREGWSRAEYVLRAEAAEREVARLREACERAMSACGSPDAADGCRSVLAILGAALNGGDPS